MSYLGILYKKAGAASSVAKGIVEGGIWKRLPHWIGKEITTMALWHTASSLLDKLIKRGRKKVINSEVQSISNIPMTPEKQKAIQYRTKFTGIPYVPPEELDKITNNIKSKYFHVNGEKPSEQKEHALHVDIPKEEEQEVTLNINDPDLAYELYIQSLSPQSKLGESYLANLFIKSAGIGSHLAGTGFFRNLFHSLKGGVESGIGSAENKGLTDQIFKEQYKAFKKPERALTTIKSESEVPKGGVKSEFLLPSQWDYIHAGYFKHILPKVLEMHPDLQEKNPDIILEAYKTLIDTVPRVALNPALAGTALRNIASASVVTPDNKVILNIPQKYIGDWVKTEQTMTPMKASMGSKDYYNDIIAHLMILDQKEQAENDYINSIMNRQGYFGNPTLQQEVEVPVEL